MDIIEYQHNITVQYCFPDNNSSCKKEVRTDHGIILLFIFLSCVSVCTVFLNMLVIISISHFKQLHTPTNLLILSLAVADLLVGMFAMPVNIMQLTDSCWYLGKFACYVIPVISYCSMGASLYNLVFIAVDRYIAVIDPLHYPTRVTFFKTVLLVILCWSFCFFYTVTFLSFNDHFLPSQTSNRCYGECILVTKKPLMIVDLIFFFLGPCSAILVLYSVIFIVARRQARAVTTVKKGFSMKRGAKDTNTSESKAAKTLGVVIFVYLACYIPYYLTSLSAESVTTSASIVWTVFGWLIYMNSSLNPVIYAIFYRWFRTSVKFVLICRIFEISSSMLNLFSEHV